MARLSKHTVDYFPHSCIHGKTIKILEQKFGLEGYAIWFKLLEQLGLSEYHFIDCRKEEDWLYISSVIGSDENTTLEVLNLLSRLGAIDAKLWKFKVICSEKFINNISDAYRKRSEEIELMTDIFARCCISTAGNAIDSGSYTQSKVKESKEKKKEETELNAISILDRYKEIKPPADDNSRGRAKGHVIKLLKEHSFDDLMQSLVSYKLHCERKKTEINYRKNSGNFFGTDEVYISFLPKNYKAENNIDPNKPEETVFIDYQSEGGTI